MRYRSMITGNKTKDRHVGRTCAFTDALVARMMAPTRKEVFILLNVELMMQLFLSVVFWRIWAYWDICRVRFSSILSLLRPKSCRLYWWSDHELPYCVLQRYRAIHVKQSCDFLIVTKEFLCRINYNSAITSLFISPIVPSSNIQHRV